MSTEREQVEALARVIADSIRDGSWMRSTPRDFAEAIVKSDVLAEIKAAARAEGYGIERLDALKIRIRAEERERIARDIRAQIEVLGEGNFQEGWLVGMDLAACIAQGTQ